MMKRVMCVWLPDWPLQRIRYAQPEHKNRTIVLYADAGRNGLRVVSCCQSAEKRGVVPGMPLAEARGLTETTRRSRLDAALFIRHDPNADVIGLRGLAVWCQRFSPLVGIEEPDSLLLDLSGCAELFGGERRLSGRLARALARWGFSVRTAIAETVGTAWAVARFGKNPATVVPPGQQEAALRPLPVQALRLSAKVIQTLDELDIRRIEQIQAMPRASLSSRFGPEAARRLDQALGNVTELIKPVRPPEPIEASKDFEHPTGDRRSLEAALRRLVEQIAEKLIASQQGAQRLEVHLVETTKQETRFTVGMLRPCQSASHLMELVQTRLEQVTPRGEVAGVRIEAAASSLLEFHQSRLFDAGENPNGRRELAELVDRLSNRLGKESVVRPLLSPDAQPEFAVCWEPLLKASEQTEPQQLTMLDAWPASSRPLRLRAEPLAVEVTSVVPDGPPLRFFWKHNACNVARCWGPERIETGWWREHHVRRDYYRVETESGGRFWLFRRIGRGDWFLHGAFE